MDQRIEKFAKLLVNYSCNVQKDDFVVITGSPISQDLILAIYKEVLLKGAYPSPKIHLPGEPFIYYKFVNEEQLNHFPDFEMLEARSINAEIYIEDDTNTRELAGTDLRKQAQRAKVLKPINDYVLNPKNGIRLCLTIFPTNAYAQDAEMSLDEFQEFIFSALFLNLKDPIAAWQKMSLRQKKIKKIMEKADLIKIVGKKTDFSLSVKGRKFINCDGHYNMPDGEIFTGPIENSGQGRIIFQTFPAVYEGKEIYGVSLDFKDGKVVRASAQKNEAFLLEMLRSDEGASRIGEFAIGTNFGIKKFTKEILIDEKIGGTVHIALGYGYPETGSKNQSALHWDLIKPLAIFDAKDSDQAELFIKIGEQWLKLVKKEDSLGFETA